MTTARRLQVYQAEDPTRLDSFDCTHRTIRDVIDWHLAQPETHAKDAAWAAECRRRLTLFAARFGDWPIAKSRPALLDQFVKSQPGVRSAHTIRSWIASILTPFNQSVRLGLIDRNPLQGLAKPSGEDGRDLTAAEYHTALRHGPATFKRIVLFLRCTGARPKEARDARLCDVDVPGRCIVLQMHKTRKKTKRPREIVLSSVAWRLVEWLLRQAGPDADPQRALFLNSYGRPWTRSALCKAWRAAREKGNLATDAKLYGTRHAFATQAIVNGVPTATTAELLGHSGLQTVQRYVHLAGKREHLLRAAEQAMGQRK